MSTSINEARQVLEEALAPYGYYFARKDRKTELPLTFADVGLFALGVLVWGAVEYGKSFLQEKAKIDAKRISGESSPNVELLEKRLDDVVQELRALREETDIEQAFYEFSLPEEDLTQYLQECGLSNRTAEKVAGELKPLLESQIQLLVLDDE